MQHEKLSGRHQRQAAPPGGQKLKQVPAALPGSPKSWPVPDLELQRGEGKNGLYVLE
jgi:hypothetical protein